MITDIDPRTIRRVVDLAGVYRMFDHAGKLLYVGVTDRVGRFDEHAVKRFFPLVATITVEWHDTRASALVAEKRAIATERPRYNIAGTRQKRQPREVLSEPAERDVLADVLAVFGDAPGLHWSAVAARLAKRWPERWADVTHTALSAECRALGVASVTVSVAGAKSKGCRRSDVATAALHSYRGSAAATSR